MTWQQILLTSAIALATAIAAGWFQRPKVKGEGYQAQGAGEKALTEAQIARQLDALAGAERATQRAELACEECRDELSAEKLRTVKRDRVIDLLIDAWAEALPLLPAGAEQTQNLRAVVATARRARYDYEGDNN